jgi:hypothetical protein
MLSFSRSFHLDDVHLLELEESVLDQVLHQNSVFEVRGDDYADRAVLVSKQETFQLRTVETSNMTFLIPDWNTRVIESSVSRHMEMIPTPGRIESIRAVLMLNPLTEEEIISGENRHFEHLFEFSGLCHKIQASDEEISNELKRLGVFEFNG